ncbi:MAG: PEP-CTERM sorting domain-containing protein [Candidatus Doudnabacteria bacterium]|jgi:hypothetical protein
MRKLVLFFVFACAVIAQAASIDTLNYGGHLAGLTDGHYYVGNAKGSLQSNPTQQFTMWCLDSLHLIGQNSWSVNVMSITEAAAGNSMGFSLEQLQLMAVTGTRFNNANPNDSTLQHVIWAEGDNRVLTSEEQAQRIISLGVLSNYDYSNVKIFDPREKGGQMMAAGELGTAGVPEPSTYAQVLGGIGLIWFARRKLHTS